jgi:UDP-glucose 4-epimerase
MKRALVTGGAGFLGHHIVKELVKNNVRTTVFDISETVHPADEGTESGIEYIIGDINDIEALSDAMQGSDVVFHTAAIANLDETRRIPITTMQVNIVGTAKCLEAARMNEIGRFMFASTVYTAGRYGSFYRVSKQAGESLCKTFYEEFGLEYTNLRYGSLYGREANHWNFINTVCRELLTTGEYHYPSSPDAAREYIHINDAARETVRIATDREFTNKAVLITGHQRMLIREFFDMIQEILGKEITVHYKEGKERSHYRKTPYSFEADIPIRVNLNTYVDISEGVLDCLREVQRELNGDAEQHSE